MSTFWAAFYFAKNTVRNILYIYVFLKIAALYKYQRIAEAK